MKRLWTLSGLALVLSLPTQADPIKTDLSKDTVQIEEVVVSQHLVLNDENSMKHYLSVYSSSIDKINERLGSISLVGRGAYAKEPVLNGFSGGQINVTIGGMKMFGACTDKMDPITSYIEPVNLKRIDINQGTTGNKNGSTIGGTFDMQLQEPELNDFSLETGANFETVSNGATLYLLTNYGKEKWAYRISGVYKHYSAYTDGNGQTVPFSQYEKVNLLQSFLYRPSEGHELVFDWLIDDAFDVGYPALPMDVSRAKGRIYSLEYRPEQLGKLKGLKTKLYYNTVFHRMDDSARDSLYFVENSQTGQLDSVYMKMDMPGWSRTFGAFAEGRLRWSDRNLLSFKVESFSNWQKAEMTMFMNNLANPGEPPMYAETWPESRRTMAGLFVRNDFAFHPKFILAVDLRADYSLSKVLSEQGIKQFSSLGYDVDKNYNSFIQSSNLSLGYSPSQAWKTMAGVGVGQRLPTLSEQFGYYLYNAHDGYDYLGNPDLNTEKSLNVFANVSYTKTRFKFSLEARYNHINDYVIGQIVEAYQPLNLYATGTKKYENIDFARIVSANGQLFWQASPSIEFFNNLKFNWGETHAGDPLPQMPPLKNLFTVHFKKGNFQLQAENETSAAQNRINAGFGETKTDAFTLFHLRTGYKFQMKQTALRLNAGVENILYNAFSEHLDWGYYKRPGRNVYFSLSYRY